MAGPCLSNSLSQKACDDVGGRAYSDRIRPLVTRTPLSLAHQAVYQGAATAWPVLISERISPAWAGAGAATAKVATNAKATMGATTEGFLSTCILENLRRLRKDRGFPIRDDDSILGTLRQPRRTLGYPTEPAGNFQ